MGGAQAGARAGTRVRSRRGRREGPCTVRDDGRGAARGLSHRHPEAMERHYRYTWHRRPWQGMRTYVQLDLGKPSTATRRSRIGPRSCSLGWTRSRWPSSRPDRTRPSIPRNEPADRTGCNGLKPRSSRCRWTQRWLVRMAGFTQSPRLGAKRAADALWICSLLRLRSQRVCRCTRAIRPISLASRTSLKSSRSRSPSE
jgi:hypothetical protein